MGTVKTRKSKIISKKVKEIQVSSFSKKAILLDIEQLQEKIRKKAYELYIHRGATDGYEVEDWVAAEQFVLQNTNYLRYS